MQMSKRVEPLTGWPKSDSVVAAARFCSVPLRRSWPGFRSLTDRTARPAATQPLRGAGEQPDVGRVVVVVVVVGVVVVVDVVVAVVDVVVDVVVVDVVVVDVVVAVVDVVMVVVVVVVVVIVVVVVVVVVEVVPITGSHASPMPSRSVSCCPGLAVSGQLSSPSRTPSSSRSMPIRGPEPGGTQV